MKTQHADRLNIRKTLNTLPTLSNWTMHFFRGQSFWNDKVWPNQWTWTLFVVVVVVFWPIKVHACTLHMHINYYVVIVVETMRNLFFSRYSWLSICRKNITTFFTIWISLWIILFIKMLIFETMKNYYTSYDQPIPFLFLWHRKIPSIIITIPTTSTQWYVIVSIKFYYSILGEWKYRKLIKFVSLWNSVRSYSPQLFFHIS